MTVDIDNLVEHLEIEITVSSIEEVVTGHKMRLWLTCGGILAISSASWLNPTLFTNRKDIDWLMFVLHP